MVATMASESYLLKTLQPPCQGCRGMAQAQPRSTSCGVVAALVLLVVAALALAGMLCTVRASMVVLETKLGIVERQVTLLHQLEQMRTFELANEPLHGDDDDDDLGSSSYDDSASDDEDDDEDGDDTDPLEEDIENNGAPMYASPRGEEDDDDGHTERRRDSFKAKGHIIKGSPSPSPSPRTESPVTPLPLPLPSPVEGEEEGLFRVRREVDKPDPRLRLYHTLQDPIPAGLGPSVAAAPSEGSWVRYGQYRDGRTQPMYAERAPVEFIAAPRPGAAAAATSPSPITRRRSRVMDAEGARHHPRRHRTGGRRQQRLHDGVPAGPAPGPGQRPTYDHLSSHGTPWRAVRSIDATVEVDQTWRPYGPTMVEGPAVAAHFVGDTTRHRGSHHYVDGGRLKHPSGEYADWRASPWVRELGLDRHFRLADFGTHVIVDTPGLYLVYAQVNYSNEKEDNGFWVYRNGNKELLCASSGVGAHTCFTAGVLHLSRGDRVGVRDLMGDRYRVLDHPGRSFIGLVNLTACKLKSEQARTAA